MITRAIYDKIVKSKGKAAQSLYRDRDIAIRSKRSEGAKGWKKSEIKENKLERWRSWLRTDMGIPVNVEGLSKYDLLPLARVELQEQKRGYGLS